MGDLISREAAISAMYLLQIEDEEAYGCKIVEGFDGERAADALRRLPSAEPERKWIPVTEALPENRNVVLVTVYWHETYQVMEASYFGSDWWCVPFNNCGKHMQKLNPIAWMPLPEPWRGE